MNNILGLNDLALELVALDFSDGHAPNNGGPTKTSRALAIIHLAAHDAYAKVSGSLTVQFDKKNGTLPNPPAGVGTGETAATAAMLGAGIFVAEKLYPDFQQFITNVTGPGALKISGELLKIKIPANPKAVMYGKAVARAWLNARKNDNSDLPQTDTMFNNAPGRHRPDPQNPGQITLGRSWGEVTPFVLNDVATEAFLAPPPGLTSADYATAFDQVAVNGRDDLTQKDPMSRANAVIGIFWGYDGANKLGTPPRLYNQVVRAIPDLTSPNASHALQIKILTAINVAMADAGIAAWHWKYEYDVWRPVVGIREADKGWGPTGRGDENTIRTEPGNPFWLPLGAPNSNPIPNPAKLPPTNFTPPFPAYPSGHSTFGSACFETAAALLGKAPQDIMVKFVSDEFNGKSTDNTGATRPKLEEEFSLQKAIFDNGISRIYLGVHWQFDADGGKTVGDAIAAKVKAAFQ